MSDTTMQRSGEALRDGLEKALSERLTVDFWHAHEARDDAAIFDHDLWQVLENLGLTTLLSSAVHGGAEASMLEAHGALEALSTQSVPLPAAETMLAAWCAGGAGLSVPTGPLTFGPVFAHDRLTLVANDDGYQLSGSARALPFARHANAALLQCQLGDTDMLCVLRQPASTPGVSVSADRGLNGEARDTLVVDVQVSASDIAPANTIDLQLVGAAMRAVQMASATAAAMDLSIAYVSERQQFGRPLAKFQAIQQQLAVLAAQSTAATVAARRAFAALTSPQAFFAVAAAKTAVGQAASQGAAIAHQVHGAMGFTAEYGLHRYTRRLWTWREEFGNEAWWSQRLGLHVAAAGADSLWDMLIAEPN
jgi:acyl-CoA dehydrogenase